MRPSRSTVRLPPPIASISFCMPDRNAVQEVIQFMQRVPGSLSSLPGPISSQGIISGLPRPISSHAWPVYSVPCQISIRARLLLCGANGASDSGPGKEPTEPTIPLSQTGHNCVNAYIIMGMGMGVGVGVGVGVSVWVWLWELEPKWFCMNPMVSLPSAPPLPVCPT